MIFSFKKNGFFFQRTSTYYFDCSFDIGAKKLFLKYLAVLHKKIMPRSRPNVYKFYIIVFLDTLPYKINAPCFSQTKRPILPIFIFGYNVIYHFIFLFKTVLHKPTYCENTECDNCIEFVHNLWLLLMMMMWNS